MPITDFWINFLNEAIREAKIEGITITKTRKGQLWVETELPDEEVINRVISGLAVLYQKIREERSERDYVPATKPS